MFSRVDFPLPETQENGEFPLVEVQVHTPQGMHLDLAHLVDLGHTVDVEHHAVLQGSMGFVLRTCHHAAL